MNPDLALSLASIHDARNDPEAAIADLRRALRITPRMAPVRFDLSRRLARAGRLDEAVALMDDGVTRRPWDAVQRIEFAQLLMAARDPAAREQARARTSDLRERDRHAAAQVSDPALARARRDPDPPEQGRRPLASLDWVIELAPDDPEAPRPRPASSSRTGAWRKPPHTSTRPKRPATG